MAEQFSFDAVSEVNMQDMKNVVDQATKEIKQRFDFKALEDGDYVEGEGKGAGSGVRRRI